MRKTALERFNSRYIVQGDKGCWIWTGSNNGKYGLLSVNGKYVLVHRWAYEQFIGKIPDGLVIDHAICQNTLCVNPNHLEPVTHAENNRRAGAQGKLGLFYKNKTHCPKGHEYTPQNTIVAVIKSTGRTGRWCRICRQEFIKRYYDKNRNETPNV